ncbi:TAXI family TRAP transporter solute-binding subunit [Hwanghaeella sp.]|uniref:TAXI family TRAP transporter solute-binding subunit n=1 Tax=Hwanghaeella sp. TaxID=2605943 RepID=UPI003CCBA8A6
MRRRAAFTRLGTVFALIGLVAWAFTVSSSAKAQGERDHLLATASVGGTYFPVGVALSTLIKIKLLPRQGIGMTAIKSAGSEENVRLLRSGGAQFGILQGLYGYYARRGVGPFEADGPDESLRSVTMLWPNVEHWVIRREFLDTGTIDDVIDMDGEALSLGRKDSGTLGSNKMVLSNLGVEDIENEYKLSYLGYGASAKALQEGRIAGMSTPAGEPVAAVTRVMKALGEEVVLLGFDEGEAAQADGGLGLFQPYTIKVGTYPNQTEDVQTIAQPNFLAVSADLADEDVYMITRTIFENLDYLGGIHRAMKALSEENALVGLPVPLHPGAQRYFEEIGLDIPAHLTTR